MKHFRLLLTLFALMLGWTNVSAQTWTADEVGEGYYLLYNVGTSQYFTRGNGWGTQASISVSNPLAVELISFEGKYKIRTGINGQDYGLENLSNGTVFVDQSREKNSTWELEQVGTDNGPIYTIKSVDNHGGGSGAFLTAEGGSSTIVGPGTDGTIDNAKWKILSLAKNATINGVENASETNPVDVSIWIKNNNFSYTITQPWTMVASNRNLCGGDVTNLVAESWRSTFTLSQTISVPNGQYKLRAQAAMTEYTVTGNDLPVVYLNDATVPFNAMTEGEDALATMSANFAAGKYYTEYTDVVTVTSGSITIGARGTRTDTWCTWDNFQLQYLGALADLTPFIEGLAAAVEAAQAVEGTVPAAIYQQIDAVVTANNKEWSTGDEYSAAIQAINNAVAQYATADIISNYSRYKTIKAAVLAIDNTINTQEADDQADRATTTEGIDLAIATVRGALTSYLAENATNLFSEGRTIDITSALIENATPVSNANYWTVSVTPKFDAGNNCAEFWNQKGATMSQTLAAMPTGIYQLNVVALTRTDFDASIFANDNSKTIVGVGYDVVNDRAQANTWFNNGNGVNTLDFNTLVDGDITIGLRAASNASDYWTVWRSFQLFYKGVDLTAFANTLAEAVAAAQSLNGTIPQAAYNALNAIVTENNKTYSTAADYTTATNNINAAISEAQALVGKYNRYKTVKAAVEGISSAISTSNADTQAEAATTNEALDEAVATLRAALLDYLPTAEANEENPIDLTNAMVDNPTVSENVGYWTVTDVVRANQWGSGPTTNYGETEFYQSNFNIYQALTLCKGTYEFGVTGFHRAGNHATYFYAGEDKILIPGVPGKPSTGDDGQGGIEWVNSMEQAKTYFDNGNGKVSLKFALDNESNTLKIGIVNNDTETDRWTIFRNFTLKYFGSQVDLSSYVELLASTVTAANAVEGTVPSAVYQTLAAVVTENNKTYTTKEAYLTAIATIEEATATAKAMQDPYNRYKIVKAAVVAISETISTSEADAQAEAATTTDALDAAVVTLRTSLLSYLPTAVVAEGEFIDLTNAMVDNPTVRQNTSYWTIEGTPNGTNSWGKVANEECEFYQQNFDFYQTLTLSKGTYEFGVTGFHRAGNHATYFYAGEDKILIPGVANDVVNTMAAAKEYFDAGNGKVALKFALENESNTLKIGIVNNDTETDKWTIFRDFTLKYYGSQVDLSSYEEAWNEAVAAAEAAIAANPNVTGEELTALNAAKVDTPQQTVESYQTKTNALTNATAAFQAAAPAYNDYAAEKEIVEIIGSPVADVPTTAEEALAAVQTMKLGASAYAEENYPADVTELVGDLSTWTGSEGTGTNNDQHWSGETKTYYEQGGANWAASSWDISYTKTVTLPAGKYMAKVAARGSDDIDYSKLTISATEHEMPLCLKGSVGTGITTSGAAQFADGEYANEGNGFGWEWNYLPFELTEETEVTFTLAAKNSLQYRWVSYCDFALLNTSATSDDYEALEAAKPENVVLGFDADDYAPYNNIVAATAMELANDIKPTESNAQVIVQQITAILNSATWTANTEEVNGVYDGTLANAPIQATDENVVMPGWVTKSGNMRQTFKGTGEDGKACLVDANDEVGLFVHPGTYAYGETFGYTLPLKAGVTYTAEAKYCSWAESSNQNFTLTILKDGEPVATKSFGANAASCTEAGALKHVELNFTPEENGNYVLNVVASGNTFMTDFVIMRAKAVKGDVNGDKKVDVADVTALVNILKSEVEKPATANVNGDDKIDAADVEALVNMILGIE